MAIEPAVLLQALQAAAAQDLAAEAARRAAEAQLKAWETEPGFYTLLQEAFLDRALPTDVRWISIIYFKNGIDKYWRRSAPHAIAREEKQAIRARIGDTLAETSPQLMAQNALAVARIARIDFPVEWPSLFADLLGLATEAHDRGDVPRLRQVLYVLNQVVKVLSATRFGKTRAALQEAAPGVVRFAGELYYTGVQDWLARGDAPTGQVAYLALKICRRLVVEGYEFANREDEARLVFQATTSHLGAFVERYVAAPSDELEKFVLCLGKFYQDLAERQPTAFILMPGSFDVVRAYVSLVQTRAAAFHEPGAAGTEFWEKVVVRALLLLRKTVKMAHGDSMHTIKYRTADDRAETKAAVQSLKTDLLGETLVVPVADVLLASYLRLRPAELERWEDEPEDFVQDELQNSWEYQLRPCAEKVFVDLLLYFKDALKPRVLESFRQVNAAGYGDLLGRDAVYCAFAIGSNALFEDIDFDAVFVSVLAPQVAATGPPLQRVILRRVAIIVTNWIAVKCGPATRKDVYEVLTRLMDGANPLCDLVVQLTAASALKAAVDEWDFELQTFLPYLENFLHKLMGLISSVDAIETKLALLRTISVLVESAEGHILAYARGIVSLLPTLWDQAGDEHILKGAILQTLTNIVRSTKEASVEFQPLYVPLIGSIADPKSELHVYLVEDALELWQATVLASPEASPELLSLLPSLVHALDASTETLRVELAILEGYVHLAPAHVCQFYAPEIFKIIARFLNDLKLDSCHTVTHILELFIQSLPIEYYIQSLEASGLLAAMTDLVFDDAESAINVARYLLLFGRLAIVNPNVVAQFCELYATAKGRTPADVLDALVARWLDKIDNMGHPRVRKVAALGLDAMLRLDRPELAKYGPAIVKVRDEIFKEIEGEDVSIDVGRQNL
ncbi:armadillo-type protein [Dipodascopsis tothii]|uniref:armadillo-type protein n=1 Tax=Dipodascopsis tothii TaxID=44089 RepID=UPI0034CE5B3B